MRKRRPRGRGNVVRFGPRAKRQRWAAFVPLWAGAIAIGGAYGAGWFNGSSAADASTPGTQEIHASFGICHTGGGTNCVVDGDTLWLGGEKIRVADIDAPETHPPRCAEEARLGDAATRRLQDLLNGGGVSLQAIGRDEDRFGRKLRIVRVDGTSVGDRLVEEGLARRYDGGRRPWC
jgi:micrococcal nuclease